MKNILFIHNPRRAPFSFGGIERVTLMLAEWLQTRGFRSYVAAVGFDIPIIPEQLADKVTMISTPRRKMSDRAYCNFVAESVARFEIDYVICQGGHLKHMDLLRRNIPQRVPVIYCNHSQVLWEEVRSAEIFDRKQRSGGVLSSLRRRLLLSAAHRRSVRRYRKMYDAVDRYVVLCGGYVDELYGAVGDARAAQDKCRALYNPAARPLADTEIALADKRREVLFVGRLSYPDKRIDRLLEAWSLLGEECADWELLVVGDGTERETLESAVARKGLRNVRFCGAVSDPSQYFARASVVCLTSSYEGWGMVLVEGQRYGAIPVAFGCSAGVREIVADGGGYVVEPFDVDAYAAALRGLMRDDAKRLDAARSAMRKAALYDIDRVGNDWLRLFGELDRR
ncbi:MAG: glycosyltransferase [Alistipes sp.]|nr:glycosyltransferase [Alistipes sp.]